jgi:TonB family protein
VEHAAPGACEPDVAAPATARQDRRPCPTTCGCALAAATPAPAQYPQAALRIAERGATRTARAHPQPHAARRRGDLVFKVNPDGSVADLNVQASNSAVLDAIVLDAVRQWRYKPIAQARTHRVQFVFKRD